MYCSNVNFTWNEDELPGCCGVLVVSYLRNKKDDARNKVNKRSYIKTINMIVANAKKAGFGAVLMSLRVSLDSFNFALLKQLKFTPTKTFINGKTHNELVLLVRNLE